ncbi:MAG: sulfotransferase family 2 domain-containing protein [Phycisphaeraceae bacterium]
MTRLLPTQWLAWIRREPLVNLPSGRDVLPISERELERWNRLPLDDRVTQNLARLDEHVIGFDSLADAPARGLGDARVIFLHIPKTGGTTLEYLLAKNYKINGVLHINAPAVADNPYALFKKRELPHVVMGHHKMGHVLYRFVDGPLVHLTMLREPVSRVLSYFDYLQTSTGHALHAQVKDLSLEAFVDSDEMVELADAQTLRIAGWLKKGQRGKTDMDRALADAKQSLARRFTCFGLTEAYPAFLLMASHLLGWRDIYLERRNVSKRKTRPADVPAATLTRIRERNAHDIALYEFGKRLFDERCEALGIDAERVAELTTRNRRYEELLAANDA